MIDGKKLVLHEACQKGHTNTVKYLLNARSDINLRNSTGETPLYLACKYKHINIIKYLLESGANINTGTNFGTTPLQVAVENNDIDIVKYLLENGANPNTLTHIGQSPLHVSSNDGSYLIAKLLIDNGADVNINENLTPLFWACDKGYLNIVRLLVENGAHINITNGMNQSPLLWALDSGNHDIIKYLISAGANWETITDTDIFQEILNTEIGLLKSELTRNYLYLKDASPKFSYISNGDIIKKTLLPKEIIVKICYETVLGSVGNKKDVKLLALGRILNVPEFGDNLYNDIKERISIL